MNRSENLNYKMKLKADKDKLRRENNEKKRLAIE